MSGRVTDGREKTPTRHAKVRAILRCNVNGHMWERQAGNDVDTCAHCSIRYPDAHRGFGSNMAPGGSGVSRHG